MNGPKLKDTESTAVTVVVIHQACTEFCSRHERQNFKLDKCGTVLKEIAVNNYYSQH